MRFLFVIYRWGEDLLGGAEIHHQRLVTELRELGHEVKVLTTQGHEVRNFAHWGVEWGIQSQSPEESVIRVNLDRDPLWLRTIKAKLLQWYMEKEEAKQSDQLIKKLVNFLNQKSDRVHLLHGWNHAESDENGPARWSRKNSYLYVDCTDLGQCSLTIKGHCPKKNKFLLKWKKSVLTSVDEEEGWFELVCNLKDFQGLVSLEATRAWRPLRDVRSLAWRVSEIELKSEDGRIFRADLNEDFRSLGRQKIAVWQSYLLSRAMNRPKIASYLIDSLRGPRSKYLYKKLEEIQVDYVIHCNLPWANMSLIRKGDLAMPLWHIEDEFYYWRHWISALKKTRFVLANTPHTAKNFFPKLGIRSIFVGPPIWEPEGTVSQEEIQTFRSRYNVQPDDFLVLTVCRKSPEKRYSVIAEAISRGSHANGKIRMIGVGPDHDGRPFDYSGCQWLGPLSGKDLQTAYAACDCFVSMSESESFGMVIPEAWHHSKPVIVNRNCPTTASLIDNQQDGLLVLPGKELEEAIDHLASDREFAKKLGSNGKKKAVQHYRRGTAGKRLLSAIESNAFS